MNMIFLSSVDDEQNDGFNWVDGDKMLHLFLFKLSDGTELSVHITEKGNWVLERENVYVCYRNFYGALRKLMGFKFNIKISDIYDFSTAQLKRNDSEVSIAKKEYYDVIIKLILKGEL